MKTVFIFVSFIFTLVFTANSQYVKFNSNIWYFGGYAGLDFNSGTPVYLTDGALNQIEGCATICDSTGTLLFYTEGTKIYNKNHQVMPNGSGLLGHFSSNQTAIIVPYLGMPGKFYVFTIDAIENYMTNGLRYNVVDMSLDGGLGDVVQGQKNILLHTPAGEKLTAILAIPESEYWILIHEWGTDAFLAFKLDQSGINSTPVISHTGSIHTGGAYPSYPPLDGWLNGGGSMKANRFGNKIAVLRYRDLMEVFDFNRATGVVSNCVQAGTFYDQTYSVELSPNGSKLYVTTTSANLGVTKKIYQYDLTLANPFASATLIANTVNDPSALQIGPDGNLYVSEWDYSGNNNHYLGMIKDPDLAYPGCSYVSNAVYLGSGIAKRGLPNLFYYRGFEFIDDVPDQQGNFDAISVFPNPANEYINFYNPTSGNLKISLYTAAGSLINEWESKPFESFYYYTDKINSGVYIVKFEGKNYLRSVKLIITKH